MLRWGRYLVDKGFFAPAGGGSKSWYAVDVPLDAGYASAQNAYPARLPHCIHNHPLAPTCTSENWQSLKSLAVP